MPIIAFYNSILKLRVALQVIHKNREFELIRGPWRQKLQMEMLSLE